MVVDVGVVEVALADAVQRQDLRQDRRGDPELLHQLEAVADVLRGDDALELGEDALGRDAVELRRAAGDLLRGGAVDLEPELDGQADGAQRAQRVVGQRLGRDHPQPPEAQVHAAAVRVEQLAAVERLGHRVDREVALAQVGLDPVLAQRDEVDVPGVARADDAPGAELAGEPERRAAGGAREGARGLARVALDRDVDVVGRAAEQPVADRAADEPRRAARPAPRAPPRAARAGSHGAPAAPAPRCRR